MNILYILREFPRLTETFISDEIVRLGCLGHNIRIFSLFNPKGKKVQDEISKFSLLEKTDDPGTTERSKLKILKRFLFELFNNKLLTKKQRMEFFKVYYKKFRQKNKPRIKTLKRMIFNFFTVLEIIEIIKDKKIDHIHSHFAQNNAELAYLINRCINIPYTFTVHAFDIFLFPDPDIKEWAKRAKKVIAISEFNRKYLHSHFGIAYKNMEVVPCGKDLDKLTPVSDYKSGPFKIVAVSRLNEKKGYRYLIKACRILKDKNVKFSCEIRGLGPQKEELLKLIDENNLGGYIKLGGEMKHKEVLDFIKGGSVLVLPCIKVDKDNDMDGIPVVLMEAMAMEIPAISTNISGIPELIDDSVNGILVPQKDAAALADAILRVKDDVEFAEKIRKKSREKIADKFNIEKNVKKLVEVFEGGL